MGQPSKKSKTSPHRQGQSKPKQQYSAMENIVYYALAAIGLLVLVSVMIWLLGYFKLV